MNYRFYYTLLAGTLLAFSCSKEELRVGAPDLEVTTAADTYSAGQEVTFDIVKGGDADVISFYSGETLKEYTFRDGRIIDVSNSGISLQFTSSVQLGTQAGQVSILASTDFAGDYSSLDKVKAATWTDITDRFTLGTGTAFLASGTKDISDLVTPGKPLYIAYRYITRPQASNGIARSWYIQGFVIKSRQTLENTASDTPIELVLADQARAGFRIVDDLAAATESPVFVPYDNAPAQSTVSLTRLTLHGNRYLTPGMPIFDPENPVFDPENPIYNPSRPEYIPTAIRPTYVPYQPNSPLNDPAAEHWAVSTGIYLEEVDFGPDLSISIKGTMTSTTVEHFKYTFSKPGTYNVVFVASNNTIRDSKQAIKQLTLTINP